MLKSDRLFEEFKRKLSPNSIFSRISERICILEFLPYPTSEISTVLISVVNFWHSGELLFDPSRGFIWRKYISPNKTCAISQFLGKYFQCQYRQMCQYRRICHYRQFFWYFDWRHFQDLITQIYSYQHFFDCVRWRN